MAAESPMHLELEIGHVLFIDVVGYSKLLITEQSELLRKLTAVVLETDQVRMADAQGKLVRLPTGDGMALVFRTSPEAPAHCALELSKRLKSHPELQVRMGIHSGPVNEITDVNGRINVTGAGINIAQRVMDCGDAGHILVSKHVADDLEQYPQWREHLHELGPIEVKHGVKVDVVNLYNEDAGNAKLPEKFKGARLAVSRRRKQVVIAAALLLTITFSIVLSKLFHRTGIAQQTLPISDKSIAVLPFENLSEEKANAFFADGVQDEILTNLTKVADLKVISRTSVMPYKSGMPRNLRQIGQQLGVAHVLEGSVQRSSNRVRVNAQLVDARTDRHLWGQTYDRELADVFAIQSEIAKTIADHLQAKLSPSEKNAIERPPTTDISAFDLYARAKSGKADDFEAVDLLTQAVAHDPSFFDAYCQLARAHGWLYFLGVDHTSARLALAEAALQAASRLRPDAGETHLARGQNLYWGYRDYDGALAELEVARQSLPNDARIFRLAGTIQRRQGHWEESTQNLERAAELDPRDIETLQAGASNYWLCRRYPEAKRWYARVLAFEPNDAETKVLLACVDFFWKADTRPLHQTIDSIRATNPAAVPSIAAQWWLYCALAERDGTAAKNALIALGENAILFTHNVPLNRSFIEGVIARMIKDDGKARSAFSAARAEQEKIVQAQPNYGPALCVLGLIDAGLGRKDDALREGQRAVELLPVEKDAMDGSAMIEYLAMIAAWVGDHDLACEQLAIVIRRPSGLSYGELKLLPFWDPLRGDPRFEKIVEEAKKPVALK
jgi:serine/threonine-protein kinase